MGPRHLKVKKLEAPGRERGGERKRKKMDGGPGKLLRQGGGGWADDDHVSDADVDHDSDADADDDEGDGADDKITSNPDHCSGDDLNYDLGSRWMGWGRARRGRTRTWEGSGPRQFTAK